MPYSKRRYTRKPYRRSTRKTTTRRTNRRRSGLTKTVARISRSVQLRQVETKRNITINLVAAPTPSTNANWQYYYRNVFVDLANGVDSDDIIGNEFVDPYVTFKWNVQFDINNLRSLNTSNTGVQTVKWWMMLVACNDYLPATVSGFNSIVPGTSTDPGGWWVQPDPTKMTFNGNNVKILKKMTRQWHLTSIPSVVGTATVSGTEQFSGKMKYRWRRGKKTFEDRNTIEEDKTRVSQLRGMNYYIVTGWWVPTALSGTPLAAPIFYSVDQYLYFKDP
ncbi:putative capsid protein [Termite associated circular virus 1]|uniref:putative capsid protein n=1 Tax=Termite associated circular virus 1 TaxID=2108549 RepID=UPI000D2294BC|nr:putative capsid protein [Termite associated circular virus 1]AVK87308.1 putative capsid protein [Termite associated circular virus 1]